MKANELRIGNLYNDNGMIEKASASTIEEVWIAPRSWCKPIQLTEEWLLKFGFEKINDDLFRICQNDLYKSPFEICLDHNNAFFKIAFQQYWYKLNFVHQLQNIYFALTGEELILNQES